MNILNILEGIEKLVVELLLWIIFIPKTLFKIIADPDWVSDYVEEELAKESGRFDSYISPILLFLATSVLLFVILNAIDIDAPIGTAELPAAEEIANALKGNQGVLAGLGFLSLPLLFSLATELFRRSGLTRQGIQRMLYIQCFYFSPVTLSLFAFSLLGNLLPEDEFAITLSALLLLVGIFIWFPIVEVKLIARELKSGIWKAIGVLFGSTIVFVVGGILLILSLDPEFPSLPLYIIGSIYVLVIGLAVVIGLGSLFRKPTKAVQQRKEATK